MIEILEILLVHLGGLILGAWITYAFLSKRQREELWEVQMELIDEKRKRIEGEFKSLQERYTACQKWYQKGREDEKSSQSI